jgi:hypothetical protein
MAGPDSTHNLGAWESDCRSPAALKPSRGTRATWSLTDESLSASGRGGKGDGFYTVLMAASVCLGIIRKNMAAKKNTEGLAFIVETLKHRKAATYAEIKEAADKKGLTVWPIMFGRAKALLGYVKVAKRGTGKFARASAAKAAGGAPPTRRGPGRPRKNPRPASGLNGLDSIIATVK